MVPVVIDMIAMYLLPSAIRNRFEKMTLQARAALLHLMPDSVGAVVSPASCHAEIHDEDGC